MQERDRGDPSLDQVRKALDGPGKRPGGHPEQERTGGREREAAKDLERQDDEHDESQADEA